MVRERLVDLAAGVLAMDPAELRRRNLIAAESMPYEVGTITHGHPVIYDQGDYGALFERALRRFDYAGYRAQQAHARASGRRVGLGIGLLVEKSGLGPWESARVSVDPSGAISVVSGVPSVGQGVETMSRTR